MCSNVHVYVAIYSSCIHTYIVFFTHACTYNNYVATHYYTGIPDVPEKVPDVQIDNTISVNRTNVSLTVR